MNQIIKRLYEDNVIGKISDDRFALMIGEYETEHKTTKEKLTALKTATEEIAEIQDSSDRFKELIQKYLNIEELTKAILGELIEKIVVHDKEIIEGEQTQKIDIYYRFVGNMN